MIGSSYRSETHHEIFKYTPVLVRRLEFPTPKTVQEFLRLFYRVSCNPRSLINLHVVLAAQEPEAETQTADPAWLEAHVRTHHAPTDDVRVVQAGMHEMLPNVKRRQLGLSRLGQRLTI